MKFRHGAAGDLYNPRTFSSLRKRPSESFTLFWVYPLNLYQERG